LTILGSERHNVPVAVPRISKEELKQRLDGSSDQTTVVDARLKYAYAHSTMKLPGALRLPLDQVDTWAIPREKDVVLYDSDPNELVSSRLAAALIRRGYRASALKGGIVEWLTANFPTETKDAPKAAPPEPGSLKG
jgi:rhodanese-related sulfurtransferase